MLIIEEKEQGSRRSPWLILGAVLSFIVLGIFAVFEYIPTSSNKNYSSDNYYVGQKGEEENPKLKYDKIYSNPFYSNYACLKEMTSSDTAQLVNGYRWISEETKPIDMEYLRSIGSEIENISEIRPYISEDIGKRIISPAELKFLNSNISHVTGYDGIDIIAQIGTEYVIEFKGVKSWWCHIGKENPNEHTITYGFDGKYAMCSAGYVIGEATENTVVNLYKYDDDGKTLVPYGFDKLLNLSTSSIQ